MFYALARRIVGSGPISPLAKRTRKIRLTFDELSARIVPATGLGIANDYSAFILDDANLFYSDVQGRMAIGDDAKISGYSVGDQLPNSHGTVDTLIVGGDLDFTNGQVNGGNAVYGGTGHFASFGIPHGTTINGTRIDFAAARTELQNLADAYAALPGNGTVQNVYGTIILKGTNATQNVFNINASLLWNANDLRINAPAGSKVIVNITGASARMQYMGYHLEGGVDNDNVILNFHNATNVTFAGIGIFGNVLAPRAFVDFSNGQINGTMVANSWCGYGQINLETPPCPPPPPPCEPEPPVCEPEPPPCEPEPPVCEPEPPPCEPEPPPCEPEPPVCEPEPPPCEPEPPPCEPEPPVCEPEPPPCEPEPPPCEPEPPVCEPEPPPCEPEPPPCEPEPPVCEPEPPPCEPEPPPCEPEPPVCEPEPPPCEPEPPPCEPEPPVCEPEPPPCEPEPPPCEPEPPVCEPEPPPCEPEPPPCEPEPPVCEPEPPPCEPEPPPCEPEPPVCEPEPPPCDPPAPPPCDPPPPPVDECPPCEPGAECPPCEPETPPCDPPPPVCEPKPPVCDPKPDDNCVKGNVKHHKKDRDCYVTIRGCDKDGKHIVKRCKADGDGNYKFDGLCSGKWHVRVHFGRKC